MTERDWSVWRTYLGLENAFVRIGLRVIVLPLVCLSASTHEVVLGKRVYDIHLVQVRICTRHEHVPRYIYDVVHPPTWIRHKRRQILYTDLLRREVL